MPNSYEWPEDVLISRIVAPDNSGDSVAISMPVAESNELLSWLERFDTSWLTDIQYQFFTEFKRRLENATRVL